MSSSGRESRPTNSGAASKQEVADPVIFRSLEPGEIGSARMNPVHEERAAAAAQINRTMKVWRAASGAAPKPEEKPAGKQADDKKGEEEMKKVEQIRWEDIPNHMKASVIARMGGPRTREEKDGPKMTG
jgi:hypothetical protein